MIEPNEDEEAADSSPSGADQIKRWWQKTKKDPNSMSFLEHLEDFRWVMIKCILAFLIGAGSVGVFMGDSLTILRRPLLQAFERHGELVKKLDKAGLGQYAETFQQQDIGLIKLSEMADDNDSVQLTAWGIENIADQRQIIACFDPNDKDNQYLKALTPFAPITVFMQVLFLGGLSISIPFILYFIGQFVLPGLTSAEKKTLLPGCIASFFLFLAGACLTYFVILPLSLYFVIMWGNEFGMAWESGAGPYYTMVVWMTVAVGTSFEFPLVLVILVWLGVLNTKKMRSNRRIVFVIIMVAAALITPGG
ncbi:MAG: twin-arginine translocase subunit TatC, partial [Opitutales bacterium]